MKMVPFVVAGLFLVLPVARADTFFAGELLGGNGTIAAGGNTLDFNFLYTVGSLVPSTTFWTLTGFQVVPGVRCGTVDCSTLPWSSSVELNASNVTFFGILTSPYTGSAGDSKRLTFYLH